MHVTIVVNDATPGPLMMSPTARFPLPNEKEETFRIVGDPVAIVAVNEALIGDEEEPN